MAVRRPIQRDRGERAMRSEFGRQIAVDLEADADFDEGRCGPGHDRFLCPMFGYLLTGEGASGLAIALPRDE